VGIGKLIKLSFQFRSLNFLLKYDSTEEAKDHIYEQMERAYAAYLSHDVKLMTGDANAKVGRGTVHQPTIGKHSLHESTNENGLRNQSTSQLGTPQMDTPSTTSITA
jgi:23S rRNA maturation-related 3'-5' exoribonuclease YhaM